MLNDFISVFRPSAATESRTLSMPSNGEAKSLKQSRSTPFLRKTWRRVFGLEPSEPDFEIITPESRDHTPSNDDESESLEGLSVDEEFDVLGREMPEKFDALGKVDGDILSTVTLSEASITVRSHTSLMWPSLNMSLADCD